MRKLLILILLLAPLAACNGANPQTQLLLACQSYIDTEKTLRPFKEKMTPAQIGVVKEAIALAEPICTGADTVDYRTALDVVRAKLRELVTVQNSVKPN